MYLPKNSLVTQRGIEANPNQLHALREMLSPQNRREVQRLTSRIAVLNRFISRSTEKCLPFYHLLKANRESKWNEECENAFQELKNYLATKPVEGEPFYLYAAVSHATVSGVLVREDRGDQRPVFYISRSLVDAETRYPAMEKQALAVVSAARKLQPYF